MKAPLFGDPFKPLSLARLFWPAAVFLYLLPSICSAQGAGSTSTNFQEIGVGARASAMGDSFTAVSNDSTAVFWNPAGLVLAPGTQFSLTQAEWVEGVTSEFFTFSQNIDYDGAFGGSLIYLGTGAFASALETPSGGYGGVGDLVSASDYAGSVAYAQRLGRWIGGDFFQHSLLGVRATVVGQNVVQFGTAGLSFDLGYLYELEHRKFYVGATLMNVGTHIQNYEQPLSYQLGGSYKLTKVLGKKDSLLFALGTTGYVDTGLNFNLGTEYAVRFGKDGLALRAGYRTAGSGDVNSGFTTGIGLTHQFDGVQAGLDYAFVPYGVLGDTHRVTLNLIFPGGEAPPDVSVSAPPEFYLNRETLKVKLDAKSEEPLNGWRVTITDMNGNLVKILSGPGAPPADFTWDGSSPSGALVPEGKYLMNFQVKDDNDEMSQAPPRPIFVRMIHIPKKVPFSYSQSLSGDLLFDSGKDVLMERGYASVQDAVQAIQKKYPESWITIIGHTDNQALHPGGKYKDNMELSVGRAEAVKDYLVQSGVDPRRLTVKGMGDTQPIASNDTPEGRAKNRRVELQVVGETIATADQLIQEGTDFFNSKDFKGALQRFMAAADADPQNAEAFRKAGDCYLQLGDKNGAITAFRKSYTLNPGDTQLKAWLDQYGGAPAANPAP